jgi:hypothetical protein
MAKVPGDRRTVHFRLVCERPPGEEFGLQDKQRQLHPGAPQPDGSVVYLFDLEAVPGQAHEAVRWRGPYVHGRPPAPFLYLSLRRDGEEPTEWTKRIKVPLQVITAAQVETASRTDGAVLEGRVSGKGSGTVVLLGDGWSVRDNTHRHS